ncbi:hypothetical protein [uncultured Bilophila sp.]|uniref:AbrB/MazE/SpoVT family DNA-binding domain-containing protein n=1 Tax=uncultured Bilophila sp. TaxID=529385 RepID=UPI0025EA57F8|nr:hypothetical protein [uncultured Bilophila sp.]
MTCVRICRYGESLGVKIPQDMARSLALQPGDELEASLCEDGVLLRKKTSRPAYRLEDILDCFACSETHAEVTWGDPKGEELW